MNTSEKVRLGILVVILIAMFVIVSSLYAERKGNIVYEVVEDRIVVSCADGRNPILRTAPRPRGGYYAVVVCEGKD